MSNFITNEGSENLKNRLIELIDKSEELKFLVGFFYFSGIAELYSSLKNKKEDIKIRVLVGLEVDKLVSGLTTEYAPAQIDGNNLFAREVENNFLSSVKKALNSDDLDKQEFYEQIDFFIDLIAIDKLLIRKTKEPNHAKLYIFELADKTVQKNLFITGSSNLTKFGLSHQNEFNVEIKDYGADEAAEYFENLWANSIPITENEALKTRLLNTIQHKTPIKKITPFQAFALILKTYLDLRNNQNRDLSIKEIIEDTKKYKPYKYQIDAVRQAVGILDKHNGVIIADVVGLGKSVIASATAKANNQRGLILCPPGLISAWEEYKEDFGLHSWEIASLGDLDKASELVKRAKGTIKTIIVDEAHRFRNADSANYEKLKNICLDKKVILLTATPFNNSPADILALLGLFLALKKTSLTLDGDLKNSFKLFGSDFKRFSEIKKYYEHPDSEKQALAKKHYRNLFGEEKIDIAQVHKKAKQVATKIRSVIEPVIVRRNRLDLQNHPDYKEEVKDLSDVELAPEWFYELTKEQSEFYDKILNAYFGDNGVFTGAIYKPFEYQTGKTDKDDLDEGENKLFQTQKNASNFMKRLLVKRLESSFGSLEKSIENQITITEKILNFIEKNQTYILNRKLLEKIAEAEEDEVEQALAEFARELEENNSPVHNKIYHLDEFQEKEKFIADINSDLKMYQGIKANLHSLEMVKNDPKSTAIIEKIKEILEEAPRRGEPKRKILIFTEYRDTANFLFPILQKEFGDRVLFSADLGPQKIKEINKNFDAGISKKKQQDDYDILLATDKISEGFNLNRAGMVINYDIPWNPVRVVQRVGRINRISNKVFEKLYIVNFFPTEKGADLVQTKIIASNKMFMIHNILGEDAKIFDAGEQPTPAALFEKMRQDPDEEEENFETKIVKKFREIKEKYPKIIAEIDECPSKLKVAKTFSEKSLLVFTKKTRLHIQKTVRDEKNKICVEEMPLEEVYNAIDCDNPDLKSLPLSEDFWNSYAKTKESKERTFATGSQQSIEVKTTNLLNSILVADSAPENLKKIAEIFLTDINDYGILTIMTMRKIVKLEKEYKKNDFAMISAEFEKIIAGFGGLNYLEKIKQNIENTATHKEIIIAVENQ